MTMWCCPYFLFDNISHLPHSTHLGMLTGLSVAVVDMGNTLWPLLIPSATQSVSSYTRHQTAWVMWRHVLHGACKGICYMGHIQAGIYCMEIMCRKYTLIGWIKGNVLQVTGWHQVCFNLFKTCKPEGSGPIDNKFSIGLGSGVVPIM